MKIRNPRDENGPDGYPLDNPAFREAADKVLEERRPVAERAARFRKKLREDLEKLGMQEAHTNQGDST